MFTNMKNSPSLRIYRTARQLRTNQFITAVNFTVGKIEIKGVYLDSIPFRMFIVVYAIRSSSPPTQNSLFLAVWPYLNDYKSLSKRSCQPAGIRYVCSAKMDCSQMPKNKCAQLAESF